MSRNNWVAARYVKALLDKELDRDRDSKLLKMAGIDPSTLEDLGAKVSKAQYAALLNGFLLVGKDESFGFTERPIKAGSFSMMCHAILNCETLGEALFRAGKFYRLISDEFSFRLAECEGGGRFELEVHTKLRGPEAFFVEAVFAVFLRLSAWLVDRSIEPTRIDLHYDLNKSFYSFSAQKNCPISYRQRISSLSLSRKSLAEPIKRKSSELKGMLERGPEQFLVDFEAETSYAARLKTHWNLQGDALQTSLEEFALEFGLSASSLRRKLKEEGVNFQTLRDSIRQKYSQYFLLHSHRSLECIAGMMGYSEASTFHRAFKKWTGMTPRDFRQMGQNAQGKELRS